MENRADYGLAELHRLLLAAREVQDEMERGPRQLKARQQIIAQKQADLETQRQKHKALRMSADQRSLQLKSNEAKIGDLKVKLNQAASNREFDIIRQQIDADAMANSVLEDEILDALEKVDAAQIAIKKLEEEVAQAKVDETRVAAEIAAAQPGFEARLAELRKAITNAEARLPENMVVPYRRLVQAHGAGALAEVDGNTCSSCYVSLPPPMVMQVRDGQALFCKTCGRLLYMVVKQ
ncbi:MAG: zinc ribbon domain-containing protein [Deltaproteobacteria bacterium]